jgi:hypothetical protein
VDLAGGSHTVDSWPIVNEVHFDLEIEEAAEPVEASRLAALSVEAEIKKRQNEVETSNAIADREISNLERERSTDWWRVRERRKCEPLLPWL